MTKRCEAQAALVAFDLLRLEGVETQRLTIGERERGSRLRLTTT
jgi:hypothetical protein